VLDRLIDHAALFPPASMSLPEALAEDRAARESAYAHMLNRFVVPAAKLADLPPNGMPLSVVLSSPEDVGMIGGRAVEALELALKTPEPRSADLLAIYRVLEPLDVENYFELALDEGWRNDVPAAIGAIAAVGGRVKVRCGGQSIPSVGQLALIVACCREAGVPFKATAGLHHAMRHGEEHGFLNLLAATTAPVRELESLLA
jgi:hypothetical protein